MRDKFLREPMPIHPCTKFAGTNRLQHVFPMQLVLHSIKGAISCTCSVVGRVLPPANANALFHYRSCVAKWYQVTKLPSDSRQYRSLVQRRFWMGVSLTRREARQLASHLAQDVALPLPYHILLPLICHLVVLIDNCSLQKTSKEWRIWGMVHVFLMHLVLE